MAVTVTINGIDYSEADLVSAGVSVTAIRSAYTDAEPAEFRTTDKFDAAAPLLKPGQVVRVWIDGTCVAYGKVVEREVSFDLAEGRTFGLISARELARNVPIEHPRTDAPHIDFNMDAASDLQPTALQGLSIGDMIGYLIDQHATALRAQGAATSGTIYDSTVLALMTAEPTEISVSGDILSAIEGLLAMTKYALIINPETLEWVFQDRTAGAFYTIDLGTQHARGSMTVSLDRCFTAAELRGSRPETTDTVYSLAQGDFNDGWDAADEANLSGTNRWDQDHKTVGKLFELADGDVGILGELCKKARVTSADGTVDVDVALRADTPETDPAQIALGLPVLGLKNATNTVDACGDPADTDGAAVGGMSVTIPTYSRANPAVPKKRYPTGSDAWYGSAFSFDPGKWGVDLAVPDAGDYGLKRLRIFNAPRYHGTAAENAAWALVLADIVAIGGTLQRDVRFVIGDELDPSVVLLGMRLRVRDSVTSRVTGYENATDLCIVGVEWDPVAVTTTIYAGTGAGLFDVESYRAGLVAKQGAERSERSLELMRELMSCLIATDQATTYTDLPPVAICADQVTSRIRPGQPPTPVDAPTKGPIPGILSALTFQKGGKFYLEEEDGDIKLRWADGKPGGQTHTYDPDKDSWLAPDGTYDDAPFGEDPDGAGPIPPLPKSGAEGWMAKAILACLANLGKKLDGEGNEVPEGDPAPSGTPGAPSGAPGTPGSAPGGPGATPGAPSGGGGGGGNPGGASSLGTELDGTPFIIPIPPTVIVPPSTMPGVLSSMGGTKDFYGTVLKPGETIA